MNGTLPKGAEPGPARLATDRLDLLALTADALDAWTARDVDRLSKLTGAIFPAGAEPPPLLDEDLPKLRDGLRADPTLAGWWLWLLTERHTGRAVGTAGLSHTPEPGLAQMGYSVYPDLQGRGFATEAIRALMARAFADPSVERVRATIPRWNGASIRVAEKAGLRHTGMDHDPEVGDVLVYEIERPLATRTDGTR